MSLLPLSFFFVLCLRWMPTHAITGSCRVQNGAGNALATATFKGQPPGSAGYTTYSCVANDNCDNEIHVLGSYESSSRRFREHPIGYADVYLTVTGNSSRQLVLVLSSYEHVQWTLHIPSGVIIHKVIVSSYLSSSVVYQRGQVISEENYDLSFNGYGSDSGGGRTYELLTYITSRLGPVASFTGTYQVDQWNLNINRRDPDPDCISGPFTTQATLTTTGIALIIHLPRLLLGSSAGSGGRDQFSILGMAIGVVFALLLVFLLVVVLLVVFIACLKKRSMAHPAGATMANSRFVGLSHPPPVMSVGTTPHVAYTQYPPPAVSLGTTSHVPHTQQNDYQFSGKQSAPRDGVLMDSAPPSYLAALNYPSPAPASTTTAVNSQEGSEKQLKMEGPPPYPC